MPGASVIVYSCANCAPMGKLNSIMPIVLSMCFTEDKIKDK